MGGMKQELSPAIDDYLRFRASQGMKRNTLRNETQTLKRLLQVAGNVYCHRLDDRHVTRLFEELAKTRSSNSLRPVDSTLRVFFDWCRNTRRMPADVNPMLGRRAPKAVRRERQRVHVSKFPAMLDHAEERSPWHRALTATLVYTLLRGGEVGDLRIRDLDLDAGFLVARIHKSNVEDRLPVSVELDRELRRWLTHYTQQVGVLQPHFFLIPARHSVPVMGEGGKYVRHDMILKPEKNLNSTMVGQAVKPVLAGVGVDISEKGEGGHTLRRSGARALFDALSDAHHPRPLRVVKDMLHHESESTTERYIGVEADRLDRDMWIRGRSLYGTMGEVIALTQRKGEETGSGS